MRCVLSIAARLAPFHLFNYIRRFFSGSTKNEMCLFTFFTTKSALRACQSGHSGLEEEATRIPLPQPIQLTPTLSLTHARLPLPSLRLRGCTSVPPPSVSLYSLPEDRNHNNLVVFFWAERFIVGAVCLLEGQDESRVRNNNYYDFQESGLHSFSLCCFLICGHCAGSGEGKPN